MTTCGSSALRLVWSQLDPIWSALDHSLIPLGVCGLEFDPQFDLDIWTARQSNGISDAATVSTLPCSVIFLLIEWSVYHFSVNLWLSVCLAYLATPHWSWQCPPFWPLSCCYVIITRCRVCLFQQMPFNSEVTSWQNPKTNRPMARSDLLNVARKVSAPQAVCTPVFVPVITWTGSLMDLR